MKAVTIHNYGDPDVMVYEEMPTPSVAPDEVLIKIYAAGLNPVDWKIMEGYLKNARQYEFPLILGWDVSGVIESVGSNVTGFKPGDKVYAKPDPKRNGAYAEYISVKATEVANMPKSLDFVTAASVPLAGLTAWQALFNFGELKEGQRVLIIGASGGVGSFAVQFAKWKKAYVIGVASTKNMDFLKEIGADEAIDYTTTEFDEVTDNIDLVLDAVGGEAKTRAWKVLKQGGKLVSITGKPDDSLPEASGKTGLAFMAGSNPSQLTEIAELIDKGIVRPIVSHVFTLEEAPKAISMLMKGENPRGKIVLKVQETIQ